MSDPNITAAEHAYWEGAASRQAEIDALKKRIDGALYLISLTCGSCSTTAIRKILKGKENDT